MKKSLIWLPLALFLVLFVVIGVGLVRPEGKVIPSKMVGKPVPVFTLPPAVPGKPGLSSAGLGDGKPYLINVFASWCVPCIAEARQLEQLAGAGVPIHGVAIRDTPEDLTRFLQQNGDPYRSIGSDATSKVQMALGSAGVPETFIVDGHGVIRKQHIGEINPEDVPGIMQALGDAK